MYPQLELALVELQSQLWKQKIIAFTEIYDYNHRRKMQSKYQSKPNNKTTLLKTKQKKMSTKKITRFDESTAKYIRDNFFMSATKQ